MFLQQNYATEYLSDTMPLIMKKFLTTKATSKENYSKTNSKRLKDAVGGNWATGVGTKSL